MRVMLPVTVIGIPYIFISGLERYNLMPTKNPKLLIVNTCKKYKIIKYNNNQKI